MTEDLGSNPGFRSSTDSNKDNILVYVFGYLGAVLLTTAAGLTLYKSTSRWGGSGSVWNLILTRYADVLIIGVFGIISAYVAFSLTSQRLTAQSPVIRKEDRALMEPLISEPKPEAVSEYIRLASLTGWSGIFTKLGFTGLPLATVFLTLFLIVLAALIGADKLGDGLFELAKLTLGAFIGSFVQRNVDTRNHDRAVPSDAAQPPAPIITK